MSQVQTPTTTIKSQVQWGTPVILALGGRDSGIPGNCRPGSICKLVSSRFSENLSQKIRRRASREGHQHPPDPHMHVGTREHAPMHTHICLHHTHTWKRHYALHKRPQLSDIMHVDPLLILELGPTLLETLPSNPGSITYWQLPIYKHQAVKKMKRP